MYGHGIGNNEKVIDSDNQNLFHMNIFFLEQMLYNITYNTIINESLHFIKHL